VTLFFDGGGQATAEDKRQPIIKNFEEFPANRFLKICTYPDS
jgi:hypothetical protein